MTQFLRKTLTAAAITAAIAAGGPAFAQDNAAPPAPAGAAAPTATPGAGRRAAPKPPVDTKAIDAKFKTEKEKYSYMVGMDVARSLGQIKDEIDVATVVQALQASLKGEKTTLTERRSAWPCARSSCRSCRASRPPRSKEDAEKNQKEGDAFLAKNKDKPGVKVTASGLQYEVDQAGHRSEAEGDRRRSRSTTPAPRSTAPSSTVRSIAASRPRSR